MLIRVPTPRQALIKAWTRLQHFECWSCTILGLAKQQSATCIGSRGTVFLVVSKTMAIFGYVFETFPPCYGRFGANFLGPASSAQLGLRFSLLENFNIPRPLHVCWNLKCVVSRRKLKAQTVLALGGLLGPQNAVYTSTKRPKYVLWAALVLKNNSAGSTCAA